MLKMKKSKTIKCPQKLIEQINQLKIFCGLGIQNTDGDNFNVDVKRAYKCLKKITNQTEPVLFSSLAYGHMESLINCCFFIMARSVLYFKVKSYRKISQQPIKKARKRFHELLIYLIPESFEDEMTIIMNILRDEEFFEGLVSEVFRSLWSCRHQLDFVMTKILNLIEELIILNKMDEAKLIAEGLSRSIDENITDIAADGITRLLRLYHLSVEISSTQLFLLKNSFENALVKIFSYVDSEELSILLPRFLNLTFETNFKSELALKEFSTTLKFAFVRLSSNKIEENLQPEILEFLLTSMSFECKTKSSLACYYLSYLLDHFGNFDEISMPKIFYDRSTYKLKMPKIENDSAIKIIEDYRELIQSSFLSAIKLHGCTTSNLCAIFKVICMMVVSVPSSNTFITVITMLMQLQEHTLDVNSSDLTPFDKNRIHAFIISIMTLICWVTRAKSLTKYVHEVVNNRFCYAPHLNPPLRTSYDFEDNHVLGYKEELFLDKWEVRYCLWHRFQFNENKTNEMECEENLKSEKTKKSLSFSRFSKFFRSNSD